MCSVSYPAYRAHSPLYCHLWPVRLCTIFPHYLINGTIFGKKLLNIKYFLILSTSIVWNVSHSKTNSARWRTYMYFFMKSTRHSCWTSVELEFSGQIFEEYSDIAFHENPSSGSGVVHVSGRTDRHDEVNSSHFAILRMRVKNGSFLMRILLVWIVFCSLLTVSPLPMQCTSSLHLRLI